MNSKEIYVSTDVEADGPIPGPNSMLSFGSAAYTSGKELIGTFSANPTGGPTKWWLLVDVLGRSMTNTRI